MENNLSLSIGATAVHETLTTILRLEKGLCPVSLEYYEIIERVEAFTEMMKARMNAEASKCDLSKPLEINGLKVQTVKVFGKYADDLDAIDQKFVKVEKKLNTTTVNEYLKENRELPEGIGERQISERISVKPIVIKEEKPKLEKNKEALDFKERFNKLSKKRK